MIGKIIKAVDKLLFRASTKQRVHLKRVYKFLINSIIYFNNANKINQTTRFGSYNTS